MAAFTSRAIVAISAAPSGTMTVSIDDSVPCSSISAAAEAHESKTVAAQTVTAQTAPWAIFEQMQAAGEARRDGALRGCTPLGSREIW